jgi:hypothetical protein
MEANGSSELIRQISFFDALLGFVLLLLRVAFESKSRIGVELSDSSQ